MTVAVMALVADVAIQREKSLFGRLKKLLSD
jgi:hypothetical protein